MIHSSDDTVSTKYLFYIRDLAKPADASFTLPGGYKAKWWTPTFLHPVPPGHDSLWKSLFCFLYFGLLNCLDEYGVLLIQDSKGKTVHSSTVFPKYFRFPFMCQYDLQIGSLWTNPMNRNMGLATFAVQEILRAERQAVRRYWYVVASENSASIRIAERNGFRLHGTGRRKHFFRIQLFGVFEEVARSSGLMVSCPLIGLD